MDKKRTDHLLRIGYSIWLDPFGRIDSGISAFRLNNPDCSFLGVQDHNEQLMELLRKEELDIIIVQDLNEPMDDNFDVVPFAPQKICLYVPDDISDEQIDPDCWGLPILHVDSWNWTMFERMRAYNQELKEFGITSKKVRILPNIQSILLQIETSRCAAILDSQFGFAGKIAGMKQYELRDGKTFCVKRRNHFHPLADQLSDFLEDYYRDERAVDAL
ncbi:MAG: hypothetical protein LUE21_07625 [Oscillospiraceae bacterium]|nr:hypothetical protein [Oscillospiraceae bacterium]